MNAISVWALNQNIQVEEKIRYFSTFRENPHFEINIMSVTINEWRRKLASVLKKFSNKVVKLQKSDSV